MSLKDLFKSRRRNRKRVAEAAREQLSEEEINELWTQCPSCKAMNYNTDLKSNLKICLKCDYHFRISAYERIEQLIDPGSWDELNSEVVTADPLSFKDLKGYKESISKAKERSGSTEAIVTGRGSMNKQWVMLGVMEFAFMGGSMGSVVGERIARLCEAALSERLPLVLISSSGGARMHEGLFSLMQMAKTASAIQKLKDESLLFISVLVDPTYGGVSASFATLGDIIIAEPNAKIGFAGPRVIEETIRQKLPKDFQTSEYLLEHGQLDMVIHRHRLKSTLASIVSMHSFNKVKTGEAIIV